MLSRCAWYRTKRGTLICDYNDAPYNIVLIARNPALKIQIWRYLFYSMTSVLRRRLLHAHLDKCRKQNADPIDLFRRFTMDLEFNIIGLGFAKRYGGINLLQFGTTLICWASIINFYFIPQFLGFPQYSSSNLRTGAIGPSLPPKSPFWNMRPPFSATSLQFVTKSYLSLSACLGVTGRKRTFNKRSKIKVK